VNRLLYGATLSSFLLKFDSKGFGFFDAAVQLLEQGRHLMWDLRSHRASARYRMRCLAAVQNSTSGFNTLPAPKVGQRMEGTEGQTPLTF
jgi:hypothetical protein